ncbi:MAG: uncharacterized protein QG559_116 [Campylobacterota bacterium]|nr:uncharacterized protein [Campylobacterota bacterium]
MKKILIIGDGDTFKRFIHRVSQTYTSENMYYVVETKANKHKDINPARFKFFEFDPTSFHKLSNLLKMEFAQVIVVMQKQSDALHTIKNIRVLKKQLRIIVLSKWSFENEDPNVVVINANEILSSRLIDYLPNVPVIAQNVGLGEGEIMEVSVPFGSSFVYRHIGVIEQKEWRIVAIYRNRKLIMPDRRRMIHPNDTLLLIGEPSVLKSVYLAIKRELGQFPEPFGSNLYLYLDMNLLNFKTTQKLINRALFVQNKLNKTLIIRVTNPNNFETLWQIKAYRSSSVIIEIEFDGKNLKEKLLQDIKIFHIGLIMVSKEIFADYETRLNLYETKIPVLKLSSKPFSSLRDTAIILGDNRDLEKISSTIFDIAQQMNFNLELYNYLNEHQESKEQVIEHFTNLSNLFSKNIKVIKETQNPIKLLRKRENFLQIVPFTRHTTRKRVHSLLSANSEKLYFKLDEYHQIFIPIQT